MAVAYDTQVIDFTNSHSRGTSRTWSHTVTGSDPFIYIATGNSVSTGIITGATYNGVSATGLGNLSSTVFLKELHTFGLGGASTGTNTVSIQTTGSGTIALYSNSASYTGVDSTTPNPHTATNSASATSIAVTIDTSTAPSTDNCWLIAAALTDGNYIASAGTGTTKRASGTTDDWVGIYDQATAITPAGSDTVDVNISTSSPLRIAGASLAPAGAAPAATNNAIFAFGGM